MSQSDDDKECDRLIRLGREKREKKLKLLSVQLRNKGANINDSGRNQE